MSNYVEQVAVYIYFILCIIAAIQILDFRGRRVESINKIIPPEVDIDKNIFTIIKKDKKSLSEDIMIYISNRKKRN